MSIFLWILKWLVSPLILFSLASIVLYWQIEPKHNRDWIVGHALLPSFRFDFDSDPDNPVIEIKNIRDFQWANQDKVHYKDMQFKLNDIVGLKAGVSHFSPIGEIAHVFLIIVLEDGREFGLSIEARREKGENFSLHGGLLAKFELIYVIASTEDLLGVRAINKESVHLYPIRASKQKARELFMLLAQDTNAIKAKPRLYHLFFRNCTNQLAKRVSILTKEKYPWYFQTVAPGTTAKLLFKLDLIDLPDTDFKSIQAKTLIK